MKYSFSSKKNIKVMRKNLDETRWDSLHSFDKSHKHTDMVWCAHKKSEFQFYVLCVSYSRITNKQRKMEKRNILATVKFVKSIGVPVLAQYIWLHFSETIVVSVLVVEDQFDNVAVLSIRKSQNVLEKSGRQKRKIRCKVFPIGFRYIFPCYDWGVVKL